MVGPLWVSFICYCSQRNLRHGHSPCQLLMDLALRGLLHHPPAKLHLFLDHVGFWLASFHFNPVHILWLSLRVNPCTRHVLLTLLYILYSRQVYGYVLLRMTNTWHQTVGLSMYYGLTKSHAYIKLFWLVSILRFQTVLINELQSFGAREKQNAFTWDGCMHAKRKSQAGK